MQMRLCLGIAAATLALPSGCLADFIVQFSDSTAELNLDGLQTINCNQGCTTSTGFSQFSSPGANLAFNIFDADGVTLSDTIQITSATGSDFFTTTFESDIGGTPLIALPGGTNITEDGTLQTAATIPISAIFGNYVVQFQSDLDAPVPEPSSIALLSLTLIGIALAAKRRLSSTLRDRSLNSIPPA
jgi:PEP-CTERM motif